MGLSSGSLLKIASTGKDAMMNLGRVDSTDTGWCKDCQTLLCWQKRACDLKFHDFRTSSIVFAPCLFLAGGFQHHPLFGA